MTNQPTTPTDVSALLYSTSTNTELTIYLGDALQLTDAFWELVPMVTKAALGMDSRTPAEVADASPAGRRLGSEARSRIQDAADQVLQEVDAAFSAKAESLTNLPAVDEARLLADPVGVISSLIDFKGLGDQLIPKYAAIKLESIDEFVYFQAYTQAASRTKRTPMLLRALFITVVGMVEPLLTRLMMHLLLHTEPNTYSSLADPALDSAARNLCFGSPAKWRKTLVDDRGITKLANAVDWDGLDRLWQDRHVITHRGSVVDARHSAKTGTPVGAVIEPSPEDVQATVDLIGATRYALVTAVWDQINPGMGAVIAENTSQPILASLRAERWPQAIALARLEAAYACDADTRAVASVNRWIAQEHLLGFDSIRDEIEAWDVSDLGPIFTVAREVLLRHDEDAVQLIAQQLQAGTLTVEILADWPLFDRLREQGLLTEESL